MLFDACGVCRLMSVKLGRTYAEKRWCFGFCMCRVTRRQSGSTTVTERWLGVKSWSRGSRILEEMVGLELGRVEIKDG